MAVLSAISLVPRLYVGMWLFTEHRIPAWVLFNDPRLLTTKSTLRVRKATVNFVKKLSLVEQTQGKPRAGNTIFFPVECRPSNSIYVGSFDCVLVVSGVMGVAVIVWEGVLCIMNMSGQNQY